MIKYNIYFLIKNLISFICSFILNFILLKIIIFKLNKKKCIQKSKNINKILDKNIPTMGGISLILSSVISILMLLKFNFINIIVILTLISYSILGFLDDYLKIFYKKGLSKKIKLIFQIIISIFLLISLYINNIFKNNIFIPFIKINNFLNCKIISFIIRNILILTFSNGFNLSDGLDGLSIKIMINILYTLILIYYFNYKFLIKHIMLDLENIINICFILLGVSLSFLWFNSYPAEIFMGDTGSLPLGAVLAMICILTNKEYLLLLIGSIFIIEILSVILQIIFVNFFNKKIFLMSPIHHHFQIKKICEPKIVERFYIFSIILSILSIIISLFSLNFE